MRCRAKGVLLASSIPLSGGQTEDLVHKGPLSADVMGRHGTHLSLSQHRHGLNPRQRTPGPDKALEAQHGPNPALDPAMVLLNPVVEPAPAAVMDEAPLGSC